MKEIVLGIACMLIISFAASFILSSLDYSSTTTYSSKNNSVRLSSDMISK